MNTEYKLGDTISFTRGTLCHQSQIYTGKITGINTYSRIKSSVVIYFTNAEYNGSVEQTDIVTDYASVEKKIYRMKVTELRNRIKFGMKSVKRALNELQRLYKEAK